MKKFQVKVLVTFLAATLISNIGTFISVEAEILNTTITVNRIEGGDRYTTAVAISKKILASDTVIIASGDNFPDALCAAPLAKKYNAPILLSSSNGLSNMALAEIVRLKATKAIIIGGTGVVAVGVDNQLTSAGVIPTRIAGKDRYETSLLIAKQLDSKAAVVIASGEDFPDALNISSIASQLNMPIILSRKNGLSNDAQTYIKNSGSTKTYIIGGTGVLEESIATEVTDPIRLAGINRYDTNLKVLEQFSSVLNFGTIYLATGEDFADALSGSVLAGKSVNPMLLVGNDITSEKYFFNKNAPTINNITILGGSDAVRDDTVASLIYSTTTVMFQDKNLEKAVRDIINKPTGDILKSDVISIDKLNADGKNISNISGIENLINLKSLSLNHNQISNIDALKGLTNLTYLDLGVNDINNIDALKGLINLTTLFLRNNKISNPDALKGLTNLTYLDLVINQISNLDALKGLTNLTYLDLSLNQINNIDALKGLINLNTLFLGNNQINNLDTLKGIINLKHLDLNSTKISDISDLKGLINLTTLGLGYNQISNIDALKGLTNLISLGLYTNQISDIDALKGLTNLRYLSLARNKVTDYTAISSYSKNLINSFPMP